MQAKTAKDSSIITDGPVKFGTFGGVFTPSILTIFGVIMFMRVGYVVGQAGIFHALIILSLSKIITLFTSISISAIATNTEVKGGGAYFLISRTLGPEFGGSIGIALFLGQTLSVPFYLLGFTEALVVTFPVFAPWFHYIAFGSMAILFVISVVGAGWVIKTQYFIMVILVLAITMFLLGSWTQFSEATVNANWTPGYTGDTGFWKIFAIYFPAVTGIMAGVNMSGNLKRPAFSLPWGTFAAVFVGALVYVAQILICGGAISRETLIATPYESLLENALFGRFGAFIVALGVFCATLSSALGSLLGAPRVLQALGEDKILAPATPFGKLSKKGEPFRALLLVCFLSAGVLYYAVTRGGAVALNIIASVVTMLFLFTYGMTNLAAFVEGFTRNPSFRPRFKLFHWFFALLGAAGCIFAAVLISAQATIIAGALIVLLFAYVRRFVLTTTFGDARRGFVYSRIREYLIMLSQLPMHPKNWRPTTLVLSGNPNSRLTLVKYAIWLSSGRGIVSLISILMGGFDEMKDRRKLHIQELDDFISKNRLQAFPEVIVADDYEAGIMQIFQCNSIGPLKPNLAIFGWSPDPQRAQSYVRILNAAKALDISLILLNDKGLPEPGKRKRRIDIWWRGQKNGSLIIILTYLITLNSEWSRATVRILRAVKTTRGQEPARQELKTLIDAARMKARIEVIQSDKPVTETITQNSADASVIFLGFQVPEEKDAEKFQGAITNLIKDLPTTLLVYSTGDADLVS
ncbi:MAG: amino acid permease [Chitinivibrionales bacterium]|nr:amino acid permease [Chitinivibrionales bacterium]